MPQRTIYVLSAVFDGTTYNADTGGTLEFTYTHSATPLPDRTGDDFYPKSVELVDGVLTATLTLREVKFTKAIGTKSNLVLTLKGKDGNSTITLAGMKVTDVNGSQSRATQGQVVVSFMHESTDGAAVPIS